MLLSTFELEKIRENIPDEVLEDIKSDLEDEIAEPLRDELNNVESDLTKISEERDKLLDACLKLVIEKYILSLPKAKRKVFSISAYDISCLCPELDESFISFKRIEQFDDTYYLISQMKDLFQFVINN